MIRIHYVIMAVIIMTMLNVGNAHSASGALEGTTPPDKNTPKEEYPILKYEYNEPMFSAITCGGNIDIPEGERFQIVMNGMAFLDRATCLVWERYPLKFVLPNGIEIELGFTYDETEDRCLNLKTGDNKWKVPNVLELMLLEESIDGSIPPREMDDRCPTIWGPYGGQTSYCRGWTSTPKVAESTESYYTIKIDNNGSQSSLWWSNVNDKNYPLCVTGTLNSGIYLDQSN